MPRDAVRPLETAEAYRPDLRCSSGCWRSPGRGGAVSRAPPGRSGIHPAEHDLLIKRAYAVRGGQQVIRPANTHQRRRLAPDPATVNLLAEYGELCRKRAGALPPADGCVLSSDWFGSGRSRRYRDPLTPEGPYRGRRGLYAPEPSAPQRHSDARGRDRPAHRGAPPRPRGRQRDDAQGMRPSHSPCRPARRGAAGKRAASEAFPPHLNVRPAAPQ
jgi:hypothetical protein